MTVGSFRDSVARLEAAVTRLEQAVTGPLSDLAAAVRELREAWRDVPAFDTRAPNWLGVQTPIDPGPRTCAVCGEQFRRRKGEPLHTFRRRQACGEECKRELIRRRALARKPRGQSRVDPGPKTCTVCGAQFRRRDDEDLNEFRRRATCSKECRRQQIAASRRRAAANAPTAPRPPRPPAPLPPPAAPEPVKVPEPPAPQRPPAIEAAPRWEPPKRHETIRIQPIGDECPHHPGEKVGVFGCPACNAGKRWLERGQVAHVGEGSRP